MDSKPSQPTIVDVEPKHFKLKIETIRVAQPQPKEVSIYQMSKIQKFFSKVTNSKLITRKRQIRA